MMYHNGAGTMQRCNDGNHGTVICIALGIVPAALDTGSCIFRGVGILSFPVVVISPRIRGAENKNGTPCNLRRNGLHLRLAKT